MNCLPGYRASSSVDTGGAHTDRPHDAPHPGTGRTDGTERHTAQNATTAILKTMRLGQAHLVSRNTVNRGFHERAFARAANAQSSQGKSPSATHQWIWGVSRILAESRFWLHHINSSIRDMMYNLHRYGCAPLPHLVP